MGSMRFPRILAFYVLAATVGRLAAEGVWTPPVRPTDPGEGELLLGELNCTACHIPSLGVMRRLAPRPGPRLGQHGLRLAPAWLRSWLQDHDSSKPGTAMPDMLHGLSAAEKAEAAEAITHFLVSVQPAGAPQPAAGDEAQANLGREYYHTLGCVACHAPFEKAADATESQWKDVAARSAPLGDVARKYYASELAAFLRDPVAHRPAGRMPSLNLSEPEAEAIAVYLAREQLHQPAADGGPHLLPGADYQVFEGGFASCRDLARAQPVARGHTTELNLSAAGARTENFGLRFTASLEVPAAGAYTFWTRSDDGSVLLIDGKVVVDNDGNHAPAEKSGQADLSAGAHALELLFIQGGGGDELRVQWEGPGLARALLGGASLRRPGSPLRPLGDAPFAVDAAKAAKGREWVARLNCTACHGLDLPAGQEPIRSTQSKLFPELARASTKGCLADEPPATAPRYRLSAAQRAALRQAVEQPAALEADMTPAEEAARTLSRLNCYGCHSRDNIGGPGASGKAPWFTVIGAADLGDEGRIPPHLNGVGAKLKRTWLDQVLRDAPKVRPYMAARMPRFGPGALGRLAGALEAADARPGAAPEPAIDSREAKWGRKLVGAGGLSCIACHTFADHASLGIPALNLGRMGERLRYDWFRRYLPDPAALRPGTRMPTFWPDGKAVNTALLGGDTEAQIRAIWAWLAGGDRADIPDGLIRASKEIVVGSEAVIYRNFIEGAGSRAIGVGYPEHANLAFDANNLCLALVWQGAFMDAARHSTDRGVGFEPPLGDHVIKLPQGAPFAWLPDGRAPWPAAAGKHAGYQFLGYQLDAQRRPTFHYRFGKVDVLDYPVAKASGIDESFERRLKLSGEAQAGTLWFRAAVGALKQLPGGVVEVDGRWRVSFPGATPVVSGKELRVPAGTPGELVEIITW